MKIDDLNEIAKYEKAIKDKYGVDAIKNPKGNWDEEKEEAYLNSLKEFYSKKQKLKKIESQKGFSIISKKQDSLSERVCPVCGAYSTKAVDDLYMLKFECCFNCYVQYVEGREERWKTGWRPNN